MWRRLVVTRFMRRRSPLSSARTVLSSAGAAPAAAGAAGEPPGFVVVDALVGGGAAAVLCATYMYYCEQAEAVSPADVARLRPLVLELAGSPEDTPAGRAAVAAVKGDPAAYEAYMNAHVAGVLAGL